MIEALGADVIVITDLKNSFIGKPGDLKKDVAAAIVSLLNSDLKGKIFIDIRAGDGILSLIASRLGAEKVVLSETNEANRNFARLNLNLNGVNDFQIIAEDVRNKDLFFNAIENIIGDIVLSISLGTQEGEAESTNRDGIELMDDKGRILKQRVSDLFLTSYKLNPEESDGYLKDIKGDHLPDKDIGRLNEFNLDIEPLQNARVDDSETLHFMLFDQSDTGKSQSKSVISEVNNGGIDFSIDNFNIKVRSKRGNPVFQFEAQEFMSMQIEGFEPVIINIVPVVNLSSILGLQ